jgi:hypothetical protein
MHKATIELTSESAYSQTKYHGLPKEDNETDFDYEERTWKSKMSVGKGGTVIIQAAAFKRCLEDAGKYLGMKIKGQGKKTYTQKFKSGIGVLEDLDTGVPSDQIVKVPLFVPSDGKRGGSRRVVRNFPHIMEWSGTLEVYVFDNVITEDVLMHHIDAMGKFIGVGNYRPEVGGSNGRFSAKLIKWEKVDV